MRFLPLPCYNYALKDGISSLSRRIEQAIWTRTSTSSPKHIVSDQGSVFTGEVFAKLLEQRNIKPRLGALGKHGSISVTERAIKTLKYEWLKRVSIITDFDHLTELCGEFESGYNTWRPHMALEGFRPGDVYYQRKPMKPDRNSKSVPSNIERHLFRQTRVTGYRLKSVA